MAPLPGLLDWARSLSSCGPGPSISGPELLVSGATCLWALGGTGDSAWLSPSLLFTAVPFGVSGPRR